VTFDPALLGQAALFLAEVRESHASVVLPAGCGKTEILVAAAHVASEAGDRVLVLTHTHAGVAAIRSRIRQHDVRGAVSVGTIDGFMYRLADAFPSLGVSVTLSEHDSGYWDQVRHAAVEIAQSANVRRILTESYDLVLVDEYQDCSIAQHQMVLFLAAGVPTAVFGDELQAIFGFGSTQLVDWERDVVRAFGAVQIFDEIPHRWATTNPRLGEWLQRARDSLSAGHSIDLRHESAIRVVGSDHATRASIPFRYAAVDGSTIFIAGAAWSALAFSRGTSGRFPVMEDRGMTEVARVARTLDSSSDGFSAARALVAFLIASMGEVAAAVGGKDAGLARIGAGTRFRPRVNGPKRDFLVTVNAVMEEPSGPKFADCVDSAVRLGGACWGRERLHDLRQVLEMVDANEVETFTAGVDAIRSSRRFGSRSAPHRATAHPLLVKGLEFDRCVVVDAHEIKDPRLLYVALTRARTELVLMTSTPLLTPDPL
jgi:hypothetical protein